MTDDDDMIYWQDVLDAVNGGRREGIKCPFCTDGSITVSDLQRGIHAECSKCHKYIEGSLGPPE
jgi:hypothetical protein